MTGSPIQITSSNAEQYGLGKLRETSNNLYQIDDSSEVIQERLRDRFKEGDTKQNLAESLNDTLHTVQSLTVSVSSNGGDRQNDHTILAVSFQRPPSILEVLELARDAYCACISLAGATTNGSPFSLDEDMMIFCDLAATRIAAAAKTDLVNEISHFAPIAGIYVSYTSWWESNDISFDPSTGHLVLMPILGS